MGSPTSTLPAAAEWLSTHPDSETRGEVIAAYIKGKDFKKEKILSQAEWKALKEIGTKKEY